MDSPTKEIITPIAKAKVVIKEWITGGDEEYIEGAMYGSMEVKAEVKEGNKPVPKVDKIDVEKMMFDEIHRTIEKYIVSVNGIKENILQAVKNLPSKDYNFVKVEITKMQKKKALSEE